MENNPMLTELDLFSQVNAFREITICVVEVEVTFLATIITAGQSSKFGGTP
jgi:hypothetical protein